MLRTFDLSLTDTDLLGYYIRKCYGGQTLTDLRQTLTYHARAVLQSAIDTRPVSDCTPAAQAAMLHLVLLEGLSGLENQNRSLNSCSNREIGNAVSEILWMFFSADISTWADSATSFYNALLPVKNSGLSVEDIEEAINIVTQFSNIIQRIATCELTEAA